MGRVRVERQGAIEGHLRQRRLAGQQKQRVGSLVNRFGIIALGFERLSRQAAGFADLLSRQCSPRLNPLRRSAPADQSRGQGVGRIDRQRLPGEDDCLGKALFGVAVGLRQRAQIEVVSGEVRGRFAAGAFDFGLAQFWFDRAGNIGRDLILQIENVVERAVEGGRPRCERRLLCRLIAR